ncbi:MAG: sodium:solute symporter family transporter [Chthoniobacterales bacterium]
MSGVAIHFTALDWGILVAYLLLTTWVGHALRGKQATIRDFFLAGRRLPWPAVSGSIIATELSALSFVGVPGMVFAAGGNFTYLQWAIGSFIARIIVGVYFVKVFYAHDIYSPYDYMEKKLGAGARALTTTLFFLSGILGASVRLLITALILRTVTGLDFRVCIAVIGLFSIVWTLMGGMTTVIWTDVIQFCIFVLGALLAVGWIIASVQGGFFEILRVGGEAGKFTLLDFSLDPDVQFTMWVALFAMPFQNLAAFGTDQLNAQRIFCCRTPQDATKAIIWSTASQIIVLLMLFVGAALYVYYQQNVPAPASADLFKESADYVFPVWITTVLPPGISGLILAGAFAAAISSLDSVLAALAQTSLSLFYPSGMDEGNQKKLLLQSRLSVIFWGFALILAALGLQAIRGQIDLISLAFGMVAYTYGPLLGTFFLALLPGRFNIRGIWIGVILSVLFTLYIRPDIYNILDLFGILSPEQATAFRPKLSFAWLYPITTFITLGCGVAFGKVDTPSKK